MTYIAEKLIRIGFILKMLVWVFTTTFGLMFNMFFSKTDANCPYTTTDGNSESIRALNYQ